MVLRALARRIQQRWREDDGDASLQMLICFPAALLLILMVVDTCNIYFAKQAATTAAREAVAGARGYGDNTGDGLARANSVFDRVGGTLRNPRASASGSDANRVVFTVTAKAPSLIGLNITITERATGPVERWTNP
ncbi:TadE/TadG family type IV pilus assembly protein [Streptomyces sp. RKAG337]|uniref:TadE/TadG family type IV pilus assembly protein n=1 Tax=Streptomyces sp. RKAG337 TaxID=2893404 RepID=UPI0020334293|nr:TadE family protein [Streptomyces sp. RKAG337]MCM2430970.1 pilus assembly protein [Streptomyces sp. RKAG337]